MTIFNFGADLGGVHTGPPQEDGDNASLMLPTGTYTGVIRSATPGMSKAGNQQLVIVIRTVGNKNPQHDGAKLYYYLTMGLQYSLENARKLMESVGMNVSGMKGIDPEALVDSVVTFQTKLESYQGSPKHAVHYFVPTTEDAANNAYATAQATSQAPASGPEADADDFPF